MSHKAKIVFILSLIYLISTSVTLGWLAVEVRRVGAELNEYVTVIANKAAQKQAFSKLEELVDETEAERSQLRKYILSEEETISFLAEIEQIGIEQGVQLTTNSLQVLEDAKGNDSLSVNFGIQGREELVFKVMQILETVPYHSELRSVSFTRDIESDTVTMNVVLILTLLSV